MAERKMMEEQEQALADDLLNVRKRMGIYYTPDELTKIVTLWAIRSSDDTVLEPSFGGCGFITSANDRLSDLDAKNPTENVFGCDLDPNAFNHLEDALGPKLPADHFLRCDFLKTDQTSWPEPAFTAIIGNPPYVSHHNMSKDQKRTARADIATNDIRLPGTASLWAYFVIHSMSFLQTEGRLALILPDAFLTSYYARVVRDEIKSHFAFTHVIRKGFHSFKDTGAAERTVCLLADGYSREELSGELFVTFVGSIFELKKKAVPTKQSHRFRNGKKVAATRRVENSQSSTERKLEMEFSVRAEDLLAIEIGLVTGANKFFIIDQDTIAGWRLPKSALLPILSRTADSDGLEFSQEDHQIANGSGKRCWLFRPKKLGRRGGAVRRYLATIPKDTRRHTLWFRKRKFWYSPEGYTAPDAFLTYMNHLGPRLIINSSGADCTNTLHRIRFNASVNQTQRKLIAVSLQTTFSQISAERVGRAYGGGVLKLEPSEFRRLRIVNPQKVHPKRIEKAFRIVDDYLRKGDLDNARSAADHLVLGATLGEDDLNLGLNGLNATLKMVRFQRRS